MTFNSREARKRWWYAVGTFLVFTAIAVGIGVYHFGGSQHIGALSPTPFFFVISLLAALLAGCVALSARPVRS